jgi:DmsE family decaheme c-type cytochrome
MCTNCHSVHNEAANEGKPPLLAKKTEAEVCYQCHAEKKAQIRKSAHMPLVEGKMGCTGCHNPHGTAGERLLVKPSVVETCYQCHQDKRGPFLWEHPPVRENCLNCHDPHGSHNDYMLVNKPPLLCQRCHTPGSGHPAGDFGLDQEFSSNQNKMFGQACVNCHSRIHGSNHPSGKRFLR